VSCDITLGVTHLSNLKGASPGAGGAILISADVEDEPIVIKAFPVDCSFKYRLGRQIVNTSGIRDYGDYEPGTGLLLTELFIIPSITQNITTCYNVSVCKEAYDVNDSYCTRTPITTKESYPIPNAEQCNEMALAGELSPLCGLNSAYHQVVKQSIYEIPARSDIVRFMMVEKCIGDIQGLIEGLTSIQESFVTNDFDDLMYTMLLMVMHTLLLFDSVLGGYSHKDLGARNVLYTWEPLSTLHNENQHWRYNFPSGNNIISVDIPISTLIPKIWDFAFVRFGIANSYPQHYAYLESPILPTLKDIKDEGRENDVYILLSDIDHHLRTNGVTISKYNNLDLNRIRAARSNTAAVYEYLHQYPIPQHLIADDTHEILHTFPPDFTVFDGLNINNNVI